MWKTVYESHSYEIIALISSTVTSQEQDSIKSPCSSSAFSCFIAGLTGFVLVAGDPSFPSVFPIHFPMSKARGLHWHVDLFLRTLVQSAFISPLSPITCFLSLSATIPLTHQVYCVQNLAVHTAHSHSEHLLPLQSFSPFLLEVQHISQTN